MQRGEPVHERKFIVHRVNEEDDSPYGTGLGLQLYWPVFFKRKGVLSWNRLCDRFGSPTVWGKYPPNAGPREKGTLFEALRALTNDGQIMTPDGTMIELLESKLSGSVTTHQMLVQYMDDWIGEVLLGQPPRSLGSGNGGATAASANERQDVRLELSQADSDLLSETLNSTLLKWICEFNGFEPCVVYRRVEADEDLKAQSEIDLNVSKLGFKMTLAGVRAKYGEHWDVAPPAPAPTPPPGAAGDGGLAAPSFAEAHGDAPDQLALDAALAAIPPEQLQKTMRETLAPFMAELAQANDPQTLLGWLAERFPGQDESALQEHLARLMFAAKVWGRIHGNIA